MKKRLWAALLAAAMTLTALAVPAAAAETVRFSDLSDQNTAVAVETLRLMGVLDGYGDGTFRPDRQLTRAQFCKMAAYMMDGESQLGRYRTVTVFPDVKPSHWAAAYINLAAKGKGIIAGYADGKFYPERTVTLGQAVTILLRLLGYQDEDVGGVWPDSYMAAGAVAGLTDGLSGNGHAPLTRAQAARLFVNLLRAKGPEGGSLYTLSSETELLSVDGGAGELKTSGDTYDMARPADATSLVGAKGQVVLNAAGKALTFLPTDSGSAGAASAAVVLYADRSSAGFSALAGNTDYGIYKNGIPIGAGDLRRYDVATYYAATNSIRICDTRVTVYYESCEPSPAAPTKITVLGGTEFNVLPMAVDTLAGFRPGDQMTLLLTADGQVASALEPGTSVRGNAVGFVSSTGEIRMLCGSSTLQLAGSAEARYQGKVVRVSSAQKGQISLSTLAGGATGELDVKAGTLGGKPLAENVMVFDGGDLTTLNQLDEQLIQRDGITYARTNWAGDVDLIVLGGPDEDILYGRAIVEETESGAVSSVEVVYGAGKTTGPVRTGIVVRQGAYVAAVLGRNGRYESITPLTELEDVPASAWTGESAVFVGGRTYAVPEDVACYNLDMKEWMDLEDALEYGGTTNLYVEGGVVRVMEVEYK